MPIKLHMDCLSASPRCWPPSTARLSRGMTLVELLLALSITAIISLAAVAVTGAVSNARARSEDTAEAVQDGRAAMSTLERLVRSSRLILACTDDSLTLWASDANDVGQIDADELVVIKYNPAYQTITRTQLELTAADRQTGAVKSLLADPLSLSSVLSASSAITAMGSSTYCHERPIAVGVLGCQISATPSPPLSQTVSVSATFNAGDQVLTLATSADTRAVWSELVGQDQKTGQLVLLQLGSQSSAINPGGLGGSTGSTGTSPAPTNKGRDHWHWDGKTGWYYK